jgi:hypothetical protein
MKVAGLALGLLLTACLCGRALGQSCDRLGPRVECGEVWGLAVRQRGRVWLRLDFPFRQLAHAAHNQDHQFAS